MKHIINKRIAPIDSVCIHIYLSKYVQGNEYERYIFFKEKKTNKKETETLMVQQLWDRDISCSKAVSEKNANILEQEQH